MPSRRDGSAAVAIQGNARGLDYFVAPGKAGLARNDDNVAEITGGMT